MSFCPSNLYTVFDIEATSAQPEDAQLVQLAALRADGGRFNTFVETVIDLKPDAEVWAITKIDFELYQANKRPLASVLLEFLDFVGSAPLAGQNIYRYDLPLLTRVLEENGLTLPDTAEPALDTQAWAQLRYPTPPDTLRGYSLGHLYHFFTGRNIEGAHQADHDCDATRVVMEQLFLDPPAAPTLALWSSLKLLEASFYDAPSGGDVEGLLKVPAQVEWINQSGAPFPPVEEFAPTFLEDLTPAELESVAAGTHPLNARYPRSQTQAEAFLRIIGKYRPSQVTMLREVEQTLTSGTKTMLEAPTGTGKTRGYLYPALHQVGKAPAKVVIATHTKVLQAQAYEELRRVAQAGFAARAVSVRSARDYVCLDALYDAFKNPDSGVEERRAMGMLGQYIQQGRFDLGAVPAYWDFQAAYRELRFNVQTQSSRCRTECPFFQVCAFQTDLRQRSEADIWITNQAWLLQNTRTDKDEPNPPHLVIDEAHNLEDVATEAFSLATSQEDTLFHLRRIFDPRWRRGWLRDNRDLPPHLHGHANDIRQRLIPNAFEKLERYSKAIEAFVKQYGEGDLKFGLSVALTPKMRGRREWPKLRLAEESWLSAVKELTSILREIPLDTWAGRNLRTARDFFKDQIELIYERRKMVRDTPEEEAALNYIHLTYFDVLSGWRHVAQPIDVSSDLAEIWSRSASVILTSATLSVPEENSKSFAYFQRTLGLQDAQPHALPETLPYEQAHFVIPSHLPEARTSNLFRFQPLYHQELQELLPRVGRSLTLFTSTARMKQASEFLGNLPQLYTPLTRREREDIAQAMRHGGPGAALGTRAYMEGVDFPDLKVVNLERIPFPVPTPLLKARQELAERQGFSAWKDVYLPRALLTFIQAFGRLIRDDRATAGEGAFVLWDKRLLSASYQLLFLAGLPRRVQIYEASTRADFYSKIAGVLGMDPALFPTDELSDDVQRLIDSVRRSDEPTDAKVAQLAEKLWGVTNLKDKQRQAIQAALENRDLVVLLPTGYGKSLTFQIPALLQGGLTLVVSPLIALMRDQVERLQQQSLPAAALHSLLTGAEQRSILDEVRSGRINLLYVSPERINRSTELQNLLRETVQADTLTRVVLDEAHCLSEWGHDFRPDYIAIAKVLREIAPDLRMSALTATATPAVRQDLEEHLALVEPVVVTGSYDRPNISYFAYKRNDIPKLQLVTQILSFVETQHKGDSVIVYASTRKQTERLAWALGELGFVAEAYHAGLSAVVRTEVQERFINGETKFIVATSAFGMGVDKANVRAVVHFNPPMSLPAYIQEAGRAGRDGKPAYAILLHWSSDWKLADFINRAGRARDEHAVALLTALGDVDVPWTGYLPVLAALVNSALGEEQPDVLEENLTSLLNDLQESSALQYSYRVGKVFILSEDSSVFGSHWVQLRALGYQGKLEGDELDLSKLELQAAEALNQHLYDLRRERRIRVYANRLACLDVRLTGNPLRAVGQFQRRQRKLKSSADERLSQIKTYADTPICKRAFLLQAFEQQAETCDTCGNCDTERDVAFNSAPWLEELPVEEGVLESVYKPLDTLLDFLESHKDAARDPTGYNGLGQMKIIMALQGETQKMTQSGPFKLGRREQDNALFGHLAFIKEKEIEKTLNRAAREGMIEITPFKASRTFRISPAGSDYLAKKRSRRVRESASE